MKGLILNEFFGLVEQRFSPQVAEAIVNSSLVATNGVYKSMGRYDVRELMQYFYSLSQETGIKQDTLMVDFGHFLLHRFTKIFPMYFSRVGSTFDFLESVENHVHNGVKDSYPDEDLPQFEAKLLEKNLLRVSYKSESPLGKVVEGMVKEVPRYFGETEVIKVIALPKNKEREATFVLRETEV